MLCRRATRWYCRRRDAKQCLLSCFCFSLVQVRGILAEYMPLEDIDAPGSSARVPFMDPHSRDTYSVGRTKESQLV